MLTIGPLTFDLPVVQAALSGYSDLSMRRIARRFGAPYALNEVVLDKLVTQKGKTRRRVLRVPDDDHPVGGQLMGSEPEGFEAAAADLVDAGYDVVDINFGCPVRKVLNRCRGGFLLSQPDIALDIIRRVVAVAQGRCPVTVKMRRGLDDSAESERNFFSILDGAFEAGVAAITVHGRTVEQRYVGPSRWSFLKHVKAHVGDRVILGSGDLFKADDCLSMIEETGVDGVTVARGCIGYPWIFSECRALFAGRPFPAPPSIEEQGHTIAQHFRELLNIEPPDRAFRSMRKFAIRYSDAHPESTAIRDTFVGVRTIADFERTLRDVYGIVVEFQAEECISAVG